MERVSGNTVEFDMTSLTPATHYTVKVYAVRDSAKSAATTTEFITGKPLALRAAHYNNTHLENASTLPRGRLFTAQSNHSPVGP